MGKAYLNGKCYDVPNGASISMINNQIFVNGVEITDSESLKSSSKIIFKIEGNVGSIRADRGDVEVTGNAANIDAGGSISVGGSAQNVNAGGSASIGGDVTGKVDSGGSVNCGNVKGDVDAGGSVNCGNVGGNVDAGGSIRRG